MKKKLLGIVSLCLMLAFALALTGCGGQSSSQSSGEAEKKSETAQPEKKAENADKPATIKITDPTGEKEVPFDPQKIAVADLATLDILDNLGLGDRVVGIPKSSSVSYLKEKYTDNDKIANIGSVKELDMEELNKLKPDVIFVGERLRAEIPNIEKIAPTVLYSIDRKAGKMYVEEFKRNLTMFGQIFDKQDETKKYMDEFDGRIADIKSKADGKTAIVGLVTKGNMKTLGPETRCSIISQELGFDNLAKDVSTTHGDSASFELVLEKNPDYLFVLDRDTAINAKDSRSAKDILNNDIINKTKAATEGNIVYLTPDVWYLSEGGITATDIMLKDVESAFK